MTVQAVAASSNRPTCLIKCTIITLVALMDTNTGLQLATCRREGGVIIEEKMGQGVGVRYVEHDVMKRSLTR